MTQGGRTGPDRAVEWSSTRPAEARRRCEQACMDLVTALDRPGARGAYGRGVRPGENSTSMVHAPGHVYVDRSSLYGALIMVFSMGSAMVADPRLMLDNTQPDLVPLTGFAALFVIAFFRGAPRRPRATRPC